MTVKLMVDWREKKILTVREVEEIIDKRVEEALADEDCYNEFLEEYIDCNYTKRELFDALVKGGAFTEETIDDIRSGVAEEIRDWCDMDTRCDYEEVEVEV